MPMNLRALRPIAAQDSGPPGPAAATLYFNMEVDDEWTTVGNWWLDAGRTEPAGRLPAEIDSVVASSTVSVSGQTVVDFTINDPEGDGFALAGDLTVTGIATFNGYAANVAAITGNAVFNNFASNSSSGLGQIDGNATFNDNATNGTIDYNGLVTGTATFTGSACNKNGEAGAFVPDPPPSCPE
jgi:hypothetical protein